ncbi:SDR family oxidoreductase [Halanaerobium salsuginis]|uniref:NAD(P)H dehydrogenase (Quinone) n=1 Tax=Halanaerobium salsuginis TaxID=29563 RepID=A0A1I4IQH9_9FIRM|nr:SDR family oxidoreductase [Halanaerobium salsuginis]SFL56545.1 NAD(P)H dehydrogenase (quinone) [Halanaerobium salsuginis]
MKIMVTGATGKLGSKVMDFLLAKLPAEQLAASVRNPAKADKLSKQGVEVRQGDFDQPEELVNTFQNIDKLLIISTTDDNETRIRQHKNAVQAAKKAEVSFIAYTSIADADNSSLDLAPVHRSTEQAIKESGIPYAFLRNNWYLRNEIGSIESAMNAEPWITSAEDGKVGWALQKDYAEAAAVVLAGEGHENKIYELSGQPRTQAELVADLEEVLDKEIEVKQVSDTEYEEILTESGMSKSLAAMFAGIQQSIRKGALDVKSNDFEKLLGHPVTPFKDALQKLVSEIKSNN